MKKVSPSVVSPAVRFFCYVDRPGKLSQNIEVKPGQVVVYTGGYYSSRREFRSKVKSVNTRFFTLEDGTKFNDRGREWGVDRHPAYVQGIYEAGQEPAPTDYKKIAEESLTAAQTKRGEAWQELCLNTTYDSPERIAALTKYQTALETEADEVKKYLLVLQRGY